MTVNMSSRTIATVVTSDTIALNAAIFGFAGHSLVTPHAAIQQIFWTDERIDFKVTKDFIVSKLKPEEKIKIFSHVSFGDDLTSCKYLDWILEKARRFFLILVEAGIPDQIFKIIDDAWTDEDLPIAQKDVPLLRLTSWKDNEQLNRKFYNTQFRFLLRAVSQGAHIQYGPSEVVPLEYVHKLPAAAALMGWQKAHPPKDPNFILVKRKVLTDKEGEIDSILEAQLLADIEKSRLVQHKHVAPVWASYTVKGTAFILTTFEAEHTLRSFIDFRIAASFQKLTRAERTRAVLMWFHCLADALSTIHEAGFAHTAIMPSNIIVDGKNQIAFCDIGSLKSFQADKKIEPVEKYNYGAPEDYLEIRRAFVSEADSNGDSRLSRFSNRRGRSMESSKTRSQNLSTTPSSSTLLDFLPPGLVSSKRASSTSSSEPSMDSPKTPTLEHTIGNYDFTPSRPVPPIPRHSQASLDGRPDTRDSTFNGLAPLTTAWEPATNELPTPPGSPRLISPQSVPSPSGKSFGKSCQADLFSLGCVFLDLLTYLLKKKASDFVKARTTKRKIDLSQPFLQLESPSSAEESSPGAAFAAITANASNGLPSSFADASFHANGSKLDAWMQTLEADAEVQEDPQYRAIPALMRVTRAMLTQNAQLRPTAIEVRERVLDALVSHARIEGVCCKGADELGRLPDVPKSSIGLSRANTVVAKVMPQLSNAAHAANASVVHKAKSFWGLRHKKEIDAIKEEVEPVFDLKKIEKFTPSKQSKSKDDKCSQRPKTPRADSSNSKTSPSCSSLPPRKSSMAYRPSSKASHSPSSSTSSTTTLTPSKTPLQRPTPSRTLTALDLDRPLPRLPRKAVATKPIRPVLPTLPSTVFVPQAKKTTSNTPSKSTPKSTSPERKSKKAESPATVNNTPTRPKLLHKKSAPELRRGPSKVDIYSVPPPPLPRFAYSERDISHKVTSKAQGAIASQQQQKQPTLSKEAQESSSDTHHPNKDKPVPPPPYQPPMVPGASTGTSAASSATSLTEQALAHQSTASMSIYIPPPPPVPETVVPTVQHLAELLRSKSTKSTKSNKSTSTVATSITVMNRLRALASFKAPSRKMSMASNMDAADVNEKEEEDAMIVEFPSVRLMWDHETDMLDLGEVDLGEGLRIVLEHD